MVGHVQCDDLFTCPSSLLRATPPCPAGVAPVPTHGRYLGHFNETN